MLRAFVGNLNGQKEYGKMRKLKSTRCNISGVKQISMYRYLYVLFFWYKNG